MEKRYSAYEVNEADGYKILLVKNKDMLNKITEFITKCYKLGEKLINKDNLTNEEKQFIKILDEFEEWFENNIMNNI